MAKTEQSLPHQRITRPDPRTVGRLRAEAARLRHEATVTRLCLDVALDVAPLISDVVEHAEERRLVVRDVVDCWLRLPPSVRDAYSSQAAHTGLELFGGDYVEEVDRAWLTNHTDPYQIPTALAEYLPYLGWQHHVARLQERVRHASPPDSAWLERFATPNAHP